ncbi:hypothetical protein [Halorientalis marina]|jgi:hypothetical protein|uniref:hypothetical protein n=1 Tax=Halorientalis marina TaxID=2931976 RepID=UPI001FF5802C|nr:hypothetical protein [Halorientalis marina]
MGAITLFTAAEYEPQEFDAVLLRDSVVVCVRAETDSVRLVPMDKVNHVDGDAEHLLVDTEIPESFYGGSNYGFVDTEQFPEIEDHLAELTDETY